MANEIEIFDKDNIPVAEGEVVTDPVVKDGGKSSANGGVAVTTGDVKADVHITDMNRSTNVQAGDSATITIDNSKTDNSNKSRTVQSDMAAKFGAIAANNKAAELADKSAAAPALEASGMEK